MGQLEDAEHHQQRDAQVGQPGDGRDAGVLIAAESSSRRAGVRPNSTQLTTYSRTNETI